MRVSISELSLRQNDDVIREDLEKIREFLLSPKMNHRSTDKCKEIVWLKDIRFTEIFAGYLLMLKWGYCSSTLRAISNYYKPITGVLGSQLIWPTFNESIKKLNCNHDPKSPFPPIMNIEHFLWFLSNNNKKLLRTHVTETCWVL